ncbi:hypothetical protein GGTG_13263 [Gaeumannomyces tritici R3-111a-1]|uniref:non-specific serine/threonine protein kinase n=1 Tax=Gaeumannomyces tritici (strain R3-111a-1) TaxID=644352 RepID=J3PID5_GAET3|nr:hypothetical protein GGTG_13263 [Gaeumannomyces tritici R3-111a-1]EJT69154.1 hypothetical protein GGTG_13263 [Gaeumannomyces tritici R3-111a-1]
MQILLRLGLGREDLAGSCSLHLLILSNGYFQTIVIALLSALQILPASRLLRSGGTGKNVLADIARLNLVVASDDFDLDRIKPLLRAALAGDPNDALIWDQVYRAVAESTPPPRLVPSSFQQTPWLHNTGSFANSSEYRQDVDRAGALDAAAECNRVWAFAERPQQQQHCWQEAIIQPDWRRPPPSKRSCSASPTKASGDALSNRMHRRVILRDYGKPIYKASSRSALLAALEGCIQGHESLLKAGFLHRDISVNNLIINEDDNEDDNDHSWSSFLIDLDLAVRKPREGACGAKGKTGTRAFMAIGALLGEQHSFMHDLESFFWVLFWICIHYKGPDQDRVVPRFEKWNYIDMEELAQVKLGTVSDDEVFDKIMAEFFSEYYQPLIHWKRTESIWSVISLVSGVEVASAASKPNLRLPHVNHVASMGTLSFSRKPEGDVSVL